MVDFEAYTKRLNEYDWGFEHTLAELVKIRGYSLSHVPFIKAALRAEVESDDGPLANMELFHDAFEMTILGKVINRLIKEHL